MECVVGGRRGHGVRRWGIVMPGGTVDGNIILCSQHSEPLRKLVAKQTRERRRVGTTGLAELVDLEE